MSTLFEQIQNTRPPKVSQVTGQANSKALAGIDHLLVVLPRKVPAVAWNRVPQGKKIHALMRRRSPGSVPAVTTRLGNKRQTAVFVGNVDASREAFDILTFARKMVAAATSEKAGVLGILVAGFDDEQQVMLTSRLLSAALAAAYVMPAFKSKPPPARIRSVRLLGLGNRLDVARELAEAEGNNVARFLTALPANKLDASAYTTLLKEIAGAEGWQFRKYGVKDLEKLGAGAFLAVAQGNADDSAAIVRLRYRPAAANAAPKLSLVGKGIIFDTGGTNLKPFTSMLDMHIDMGGSAVVAGTLLALTRLGYDAPVDAWFAITENRTGPTAYKPQDVVTALNGKTIQTIHTDAEGRMALADTLSMACEDGPAAVIDYATLTGACMNAVTTRYSGVFTNRPDLHPVLKKCGRESGERVWPFPVGKEFLEELKSETADIAQCAPNGGGDHILAASFLNEFVDEKVAWVHVDLSACSRKGGLAHIPSQLTGFGVRFSLDLILDKDLTGSVGDL
jgi:leucyl aminopeptidase